MSKVGVPLLWEVPSLGSKEPFPENINVWEMSQSAHLGTPWIVQEK